MNYQMRPARRGFLRGLALLPLLGGGATLIREPAAAAEPDPISALLAEEQVAYDHWMASVDDEQGEARQTAYRELEKRIYATQPTTMAGLVALMDLFEKREDMDREYAPDSYVLAMFGYARALATSA